MRICILFGSLRENSNTGLLVQPFIAELERLGAAIDFITLKDKNIEPCTACWTCQNIFEGRYEDSI
jgi:multimeric flavodoxin WrbA